MKSAEFLKEGKEQPDVYLQLMAEPGQKEEKGGFNIL